MHINLNFALKLGLFQVLNKQFIPFQELHQDQFVSPFQNRAQTNLSDLPPLERTQREMWFPSLFAYNSEGRFLKFKIYLKFVFFSPSNIHHDGQTKTIIQTVVPRGQQIQARRERSTHYQTIKQNAVVGTTETNRRYGGSQPTVKFKVVSNFSF